MRRMNASVSVQVLQVPVELAPVQISYALTAASFTKIQDYNPWVQRSSLRVTGRDERTPRVADSIRGAVLMLLNRVSTDAPQACGAACSCAEVLKKDSNGRWTLPSCC